MDEKTLTALKPPYETCPSCSGSGLGLNMAGEPDNCWECKGDTVVRARDERGRFVGNTTLFRKELETA